MYNLLSQIISTVLIIVPLLIAVAFFTAAERKIMASIQRRKGPNVVGFWGLLQPLADGLKLVTKEIIFPNKVHLAIFIISSTWTLYLSLLGWAVIPFSLFNYYVNLNLSLLYILAISSLGIYGVLLAGWSSNSKYAFLAAIRSIAQMISYEITLGLIILPVVICSGSLQLSSIVLAQRNVWYLFPMLPLFIMFFISVLAETNRAPFDLPEAEAELVAGYNLEYSGILFAMFFLGEYSNMLLMSGLCTILFCGGWLAPFSFLAFIPGEFWFGIKIAFFAFMFVLVRSCLPRFRYDQLLDIGWKIFLPVVLGYLILVAGILVAFDGLPISFQ
jgi:NADH-quinone oxidoreductase subunit H